MNTRAACCVNTLIAAGDGGMPSTIETTVAKDAWPKTSWSWFWRIA